MDLREFDAYKVLSCYRRTWILDRVLMLCKSTISVIRTCFKLANLIFLIFNLAANRRTDNTRFPHLTYNSTFTIDSGTTLSGLKPRIEALIGSFFAEVILTEIWNLGCELVRDHKLMYDDIYL